MVFIWCSMKLSINTKIYICSYIRINTDWKFSENGAYSWQLSNIFLGTIVLTITLNYHITESLQWYCFSGSLHISKIKFWIFNYWVLDLEICWPWSQQDSNDFVQRAFLYQGQFLSPNNSMSISIPSSLILPICKSLMIFKEKTILMTTV